MKKILFVTEIISPYRVPFLNILDKLFNAKGMKLDVIFLRESEERRSWEIEKDKLTCSYSVAKSFLLQKTDKEPHYFNFGLKNEVKKLNPDIIILGGFAQLAYWDLLMWARKNKKKAILFCESFQNAGPIRYFLFKRFFIKNCAKFVVPGNISKEYLLRLGANQKDIFIAPDAVENDFYTDKSHALLGKKTELKKEKKFPDRIILYVGRIAKVKGLYDLLDVFKKISSESKDVGLILIGSSNKIDSFKKYCRHKNIENVFFEGHKQKEELVKYYALADVFVLPALYDPWGMVINEAMLSKLAIVASDRSQAAFELLKDAENGFLHKAGNRQQLYQKINILLENEKLRAYFAEKAFEDIRKITPQIMAKGFLEAVESCFKE